MVSNLAFYKWNTFSRTPCDILIIYWKNSMLILNCYIITFNTLSTYQNANKVTFLVIFRIFLFFKRNMVKLWARCWRFFQPNHIGIFLILQGKHMLCALTETLHSWLSTVPSKDTDPLHRCTSWSKWSLCTQPKTVSGVEGELTTHWFYKTRWRKVVTSKLNNKTLAFCGM